MTEYALSSDAARVSLSTINSVDLLRQRAKPGQACFTLASALSNVIVIVRHHDNTSGEGCRHGQPIKAQSRPLLNIERYIDR